MNNGVKGCYQVSGLGLFVLLHGFPDFSQESLDTFLGRLDEQLAFILAYILPKKVEPLLNMCYFGFLLRKLQTPGSQKLLYQGNALLFQ
jgi:hypothetical protein